jgi:hypothetical protein
MSVSLRASSTGPTSPGHCLHLPLPAPSHPSRNRRPSTTEPCKNKPVASIHVGSASRFCIRTDGVTRTRIRRRGPCEAIPKTLTKTGFWPRYQPSLPGLMLPTELRQGLFADPPIQRSDRDSSLVYSSSRRYFAILNKNPHPTAPSPSLCSMDHVSIGRLVLSLHCKGQEALSLLPLSSESNIRHVL